jgi:hypothetical protein
MSPRIQCCIGSHRFGTNFSSKASLSAQFHLSRVSFRLPSAVTGLVKLHCCIDRGVEGRQMGESIVSSLGSIFGSKAYPIVSRFACPDVARARWRWAPAYFITMARLLWPVIAGTSSSEAPAAASCEAAV